MVGAVVATDMDVAGTVTVEAAMATQGMDMPAEFAVELQVAEE
jgi:hypothetical protein